jgi:hypothetical protein
MEPRRAARGAVRGDGPPETHRSWVDLEPRASFCNTDRLYTEWGTRRTRPGAPGGGSGDGQEPPRPAADGIDRCKAGDGTRHLECEQKRRRWPPYLAATLHVRSWRRGGSDGGDRARAALQGRKNRKNLRRRLGSAGKGTLLGVGSLCGWRTRWMRTRRPRGSARLVRRSTRRPAMSCSRKFHGRRRAVERDEELGRGKERGRGV